MIEFEEMASIVSWYGALQEKNLEELQYKRGRLSYLMWPFAKLLGEAEGREKASAYEVDRVKAEAFARLHKESGTVMATNLRNKEADVVEAKKEHTKDYQSRESARRLWKAAEAVLMAMNGDIHYLKNTPDA